MGAIALGAFILGLILISSVVLNPLLSSLSLPFVESLFHIKKKSLHLPTLSHLNIDNDNKNFKFQLCHCIIKRAGIGLQ